MFDTQLMTLVHSLVPKWLIQQFWLVISWLIWIPPPPPPFFSPFFGVSKSLPYKFKLEILATALTNWAGEQFNNPPCKIGLKKQKQYHTVYKRNFSATATLSYGKIISLLTDFAGGCWPDRAQDHCGHLRRMGSAWWGSPVRKGPGTDWPLCILRCSLGGQVLGEGWTVSQGPCTGGWVVFFFFLFSFWMQSVVLFMRIGSIIL